jgi:type II secretory pathway pseudopilin PulG
MKNKKGISLIVLVITIIVIIILAAAVILTLTDNNPINNAKAASIAQNKDSVESSINLYVAQKIAATQGTFSTSNILLGDVTGITGAGDPILEAGTTTMKIVPETATAINLGTEAAPINVYEIDAATFKTNVKITLPTAPASSKWYIDTASNKVYLIFTTAIPTWLSGTNLEFVKTTVV